MSITQRRFLHQPARRTEIIAGYINLPRGEDEQLDFKRIPWETGRGVEAAKDIAAFANQLGGDIILGITDKADYADGWFPIPNAEIAKVGSSIRQWLINYLRPHDFAEAIEIEPVAAQIPNHSVITVSIPPSPNLVGVETRESDRVFLQFPIRIGKRTRWLTFDEVMRRSSLSTRGIYIKLKGLIDSFGTGAEPEVRFSNPVTMIDAGMKMYLSGGDGMARRLISLTEDTVTVNMQPAPGHAAKFDHKLTIPLELISAVWRDQKNPSQSAFVAMALSAEVMWDGSDWVLLTRASR